jgi:hypothetical protein
MFYHNPMKPATPAQRRLLSELGVSAPAGLSSYQADRLIKANHSRWAALPPTGKQIGMLRALGLWAKGITRGEAAEMIDKIRGGGP